MKKDFIVRRSITIVEGKPHVETYSEQELVRCKECKWAWNINPTEEEMFYVCKNPTMVNMRYSHQGDWFCADGEKKL